MIRVTAGVALQRPRCGHRPAPDYGAAQPNWVVSPAAPGSLSAQTTGGAPARRPATASCCFELAEGGSEAGVDEVTGIMTGE